MTYAVLEDGENGDREQSGEVRVGLLKWRGLCNQGPEVGPMGSICGKESARFTTCSYFRTFLLFKKL